MTQRERAGAGAALPSGLLSRRARLGTHAGRLGTRVGRWGARVGESPAEHAQARPRWWGELIVVAFLAVLYDAINNLAPTREALALAHGRSILGFESSLGIAPELTLNHWLSAHHALATIASYYYDNAHFAVTFGLLGWLCFKRANIYRPLRTTLVLTNAIGLLVFWLCPVAPPRMLAGGFSDVVAATHTFGSWHTGKLASDANQLAAMPSLHLAWAAWCSLAIWRMSAGWPRRGGRRLRARMWARALAIAYPALTTLVVLATGNHYLLDVLAGIATFALAVALTTLFSATRRRLPARRRPAAWARSRSGS